MSHPVIDALAAEVALAKEVMAGLRAEEWALPSDCAGWRVQDVFCHMASVFHVVADAASMPAGDPEGDAEKSAEIVVGARRDWTPEQVMTEYGEWSEKGIATMAAMQEEPMASAAVPLGNLGTHPLRLLANALVFDHYCHLRHDLLQPDGPLARPALPSDEQRLAPTMEWMLAGLPQMCAAALAFADRAVVLRFEGPGGGVWTLRPVGADGLTSVEAGASSDAVGSARSSTHAFVQWGTKRRPWAARGVVVDGDRDYVGRVLDAINII